VEGEEKEEEVEQDQEQEYDEENNEKDYTENDIERHEEIMTYMHLECGPPCE